MDDEAVDDEAEDDEAEEAMWRDTRLQGGGRELSRLRGGVLYEVASLREKAKDEEERQQVEAVACYETKSSVEGARTTESKAVKELQCDGTMYKHTTFGWDKAPVTYTRAHVGQASKRRPVNLVMYEHLIENLLPQECHVHWETVWRKCESCHSRDLQLRLGLHLRRVQPRSLRRVALVFAQPLQVARAKPRRHGTRFGGQRSTHVAE